MSFQLDVRARWSALLAALVVASTPAWSQTPLTLAEALRLAEAKSPERGVLRRCRARRTRIGRFGEPVAGPSIARRARQPADQRSRRVVAGPRLHDHAPHRRHAGIRLECQARRLGRSAVSVRRDGTKPRPRCRARRSAPRWRSPGTTDCSQSRAEGLQQALEQEIAMQRRASEAQVASGKASAADVLMVDALLIQSRDRVLAARRQQQVATARLSRWLGDEASRPPAGDDGLPRESDVLALPEHDLHNIAHLRVLAVQVDVADAEVEVAEQNRSPNWSWEVSYQQRGPAYSNMISVGVSVPLPIARGERQDRDLAARLAQRDQARDQLADARRRHVSEFNTMRIEWLALRERQRELESALLPIVRQRVDAVLAAYGSGQQSLAAVLDARRARGRCASPDTRAGTGVRASLGPAALHVSRRRRSQAMNRTSSLAACSSRLQCPRCSMGLITGA